MYQLLPTGVLRTADGAVIPSDVSNKDYAAYLDWKGKGNTPLPLPVLPPAIPYAVSPFQAQAALDEIGKLAQVEALMTDPATPKKTKMAWNKATEFRRTSPTVLAMAQAIGLTSAQLDDLFIRAAQIEA